MSCGRVVVCFLTPSVSVWEHEGHSYQRIMSIFQQNINISEEFYDKIQVQSLLFSRDTEEPTPLGWTGVNGAFVPDQHTVYTTSLPSIGTFSFCHLEVWRIQSAFQLCVTMFFTTVSVVTLDFQGRFVSPVFGFKSWFLVSTSGHASHTKGLLFIDVYSWKAKLRWDSFLDLLFLLCRVRVLYENDNDKKPVKINKFKI